MNFKFKSSKTRFTGRVMDYIRYRPGYPKEIISFLHEQGGMKPGLTVVDVGSGSGIFSKMLLDNDHIVFGVEPNNEMRQAAEKALSNYPDFYSINGTGEQTGLKDNSVDAITVAQAFHWFDYKAARKEFLRILKKDGPVAIIWYDRKLKGDAFSIAYEAFLIKWGIDYKQVDHRKIDHNVLKSFFGHEKYITKVLQYSQKFDSEGLQGRVLSSSYVPGRDDPRHVAMINELAEMFDKFQQNGNVKMKYDVRIIMAKIL